jgi:uncharacterized protein YbcI
MNQTTPTWAAANSAITGRPCDEVGVSQAIDDWRFEPVEAKVIWALMSWPANVLMVARRVIALRLAREPDPEDEREGRMSATNKVLAGDELLVAVSDELVGFHQRYYHRRPVTGRSRLLSQQLLACVLGSVESEVEQAFIELEGTTILQEARSSFQDAMQHDLIAAVTRLSGRDVQAFISNSHVGSDVEVELFMLNTPPGVAPERRRPLESVGRGYAWAVGMSTEPRRAGQGSVSGYSYAWERPRAG